MMIMTHAVQIGTRGQPDCWEGFEVASSPGSSNDGGGSSSSTGGIHRSDSGSSNGKGPDDVVP